MSYRITTLILAIVLIGCGLQNISKEEIAKKYFEARNSLAFNEIKKFISDSLIVIEGDYIMPYSQESYYEVFKWDSIFQPSYKLVEVIEKDNQCIASIDISSIRNTFLKNELMTCKFKLSFDSGKISKIESLDCSGADWGKWEKQRDSLVSWINDNHPELNGFINDMSPAGAKNYLKAIELFELEYNNQ